MDCSPLGSSVYEILQARILECVVISFSRGSVWPGDQTCVSYISCTGRQVLYHCCHLGSPHTGWKKKKSITTKYGTTDWFKVRSILSPCLFNFYAGYIMRNAGLDDSHAGIRIAWRNINNLRYADDTTPMVESEKELKSLGEGERGEWKSWLKTQHSKNEDHGIWSHTS